jgi:copper resistance protein C
MNAFVRNLFLAALLAGAPFAFAHSHPTAMTPAANSTVSAPGSIVIHFSEALEAKFSSISLADAAGHVVSKEPASRSTDGKIMTLKVPVLAPGSYTVNWVAVATDAHRTEGNYKFTVK